MHESFLGYLLLIMQFSIGKMIKKIVHRFPKLKTGFQF